MIFRSFYGGETIDCSDNNDAWVLSVYTTSDGSHTLRSGCFDPNTFTGRFLRIVHLMGVCYCEHTRIGIPVD
jgi:hypothetical protein